MSRSRVFIYGSEVSLDTFEHLDPGSFELVDAVTGQSALSAYTRPVRLLPRNGITDADVLSDLESDLRSRIAVAARATDLVLVDLAVERHGAHVLSDGTVVTRTPRLIASPAEAMLPADAQFLPFGTERHLQYWTDAMASVGDMFGELMPRAAVALIDIPWAWESEEGEPVPGRPDQARHEIAAILDAYHRIAATALGSRTLSVDASTARSSMLHPRGPAHVHYAEAVYVEIVRQLTGAPGRTVWGGPLSPVPTSSAPMVPAVRVPEGSASPAAQFTASTGTAPATPSPSATGPNLFLAGTQCGGVGWLARELARHPDIFFAGPGEMNFLSTADVDDPAAVARYRAEFDDAGTGKRWRAEHTAHYFWHGDDSPFSTMRRDVAAAIQDHAAPDSRVILSLRDPVSRAVAGYWHNFAAGRFDLSTSIFRLSEGLGVVDLGFYRRHYEHWARTLGADRLTVLLYDDLVVDPKRFIAEALDGVGLEGTPTFWNSLSGKGREDDGPGWLTPFRRRRPVSAQEVSALLELYREDIDFVEELLGRDLSAWRDRAALIRRLT